MLRLCCSINFWKNILVFPQVQFSPPPQFLPLYLFLVLCILATLYSDCAALHVWLGIESGCVALSPLHPLPSPYPKTQLCFGPGQFIFLFNKSWKVILASFSQSLLLYTWECWGKTVGEAGIRMEWSQLVSGKCWLILGTGLKDEAIGEREESGQDVKRKRLKCACGMSCVASFFLWPDF